MPRWSQTGYSSPSSPTNATRRAKGASLTGTPRQTPRDVRERECERLNNNENPKPRGVYTNYERISNQGTRVAKTFEFNDNEVKCMKLGKKGVWIPNVNKKLEDYLDGNISSTPSIRSESQSRRSGSSKSRKARGGGVLKKNRKSKKVKKRKNKTLKKGI